MVKSAPETVCSFAFIEIPSFVTDDRGKVHQEPAQATGRRASLPFLWFLPFQTFLRFPSRMSLFSVYLSFLRGLATWPREFRAMGPCNAGAESGHEGGRGCQASGSRRWGDWPPVRCRHVRQACTVERFQKRGCLGGEWNCRRPCCCSPAPSDGDCLAPLPCYLYPGLGGKLQLLNGSPLSAVGGQRPCALRSMDLQLGADEGCYCMQ